MLPAITLRCPVCHRQAPILLDRFGHHGRGKKGCSGSLSPIQRQPLFSFTATLNTAAVRKTSVTIAVEGITPTLTYEFEGPGHLVNAERFSEQLSVPVFNGQALLERLAALETEIPGLRRHFQANLSFCLAVLHLTPTPTIVAERAA